MMINPGELSWIEFGMGEGYSVHVSGKNDAHWLTVWLFSILLRRRARVLLFSVVSWVFIYMIDNAI